MTEVIVEQPGYTGSVKKGLLNSYGPRSHALHLTFVSELLWHQASEPCCTGATIHTRPEIQFLPYAGFLLEALDDRLLWVSVLW